MELLVLIVGFNWFLSWPIAYRVLVRPLDKLLAERETLFLEHGVVGLSILFRGMQYASLIVRPSKMKMKYYKLTYGDFNFRESLSKFQLFVAYYFYISTNVLFAVAFVVAAHDLVFFRDAPWFTLESDVLAQ